MKFTELTVVVDGTTYNLEPYDRGAKGAYVYRYKGVTINAHRAVITTDTNDAASDKYVIQDNIPRICAPVDASCGVDTVLGTDLLKTELRFLATSSSVDRGLALDQHIALLQELRSMIMDREKLYA